MTPCRTFAVNFALVLALTLPALPGQQKAVALFDGKTLEGWEQTGQTWRVVDGVVMAGTGDRKIPKNDFISTKKTYANFDLTLKIRCRGDKSTGMLNSGIQVRSARLDNGSVAGYQIDCGEGWFGKIFDEHRRRLIYPKPLNEAALTEAIDVLGWNEYRILAEGPRIRVWINGVMASDYVEENPLIPLDGIIAPQIHSGGHAIVEFKDITIKELPATPGTPTWESLGGPEKALQLVKTPRKRPDPAPKGAARTDARSSAGASAAAPPPLKPRKDITSYNGQGEPRPATEQAGKFHLPEGYEIELVAQESGGIGKFVTVYFDQRGNLWTQTALEYPLDAKEDPGAAKALYEGRGRDRILVFPRESVNQRIPAGGLTDQTIFADGLAMPVGILPWGDGRVCYSIHGPDLLRLTDTDGDGISDRRDVILTGFGIEDSHLFPHQFTRAPGGWIWMNQGLYNMSRVKRPGDKESVLFPKCSMARMRPDGSEFEVTSVGPNNVWGLAITGEGEAFIQEANDFGHSVVEFHDYAYYPGGMRSYRRSYQPEMPAVDFRLGGTGLSGLAILESGPERGVNGASTMLVANAITGAINTVGMNRDGAYWNYEHLDDFMTCDDPLFRPIALTQGPDGSIYVVDWYNKIISHNEVARNHPDRDRTRGRIWRIRPTDETGTTEIPDFTSESDESLVEMLGELPTARAHLAWQTLADRGASPSSVLTAADASDARKIQAFWALSPEDRKQAAPLARSQNRNVRRELARYPEFADLFLDDPDREVRFVTIQTLAKQLPAAAEQVLPKLLAFARPSIPNPPTTRSSRSAEQIPIREGYDREFERYLVRMFLEKHPAVLETFLDSRAAAALEPEALALATLALEPLSATQRIGKYLAALDRPPNSEEILLLAKYPDAPGVGASVKAMLANPETSPGVTRTLLANQSKIDPKKIKPLLTPAVKALLAEGKGATAAPLIGTFQLNAFEPDLVAILKDRERPEPDVLAALDALGQLKSAEVDAIAALVSDPPTAEIGKRALIALAESASPEAAKQVIAALPSMTLSDQRATLARLASRPAGAAVVVTAFNSGEIAEEALEVSTAERLVTVLKRSPERDAFMKRMGGVFREVLVLNGSGTAWIDSQIELEGPFTIESWVRLDEGITNADSLLANPGAFDLNFSGSTFRFWAGRQLRDVAISKRPMTPGFWTHLAVTRDEAGQITLYADGEFDVAGSKPVTGKYSNLSVGRSTPANTGTQGALAEYRVWNVARSAEEVRRDFDRSFADGPRPSGLVYYNSGGDRSRALGKGARVMMRSDVPPLLTAEQSELLAAKFAKYTALGEAGGDPVKGQAMAVLCTSCHVINGSGGKIGPDISGAGAMGMEGVLRNILTPNAAMESGYRVFRVELKNGEVLDTFFVGEDKASLVVRQPGGPDRRIDRKDVTSTRYVRRSLMPAGLLDGLSDEMAADLLAYLMTLK